MKIPDSGNKSNFSTGAVRDAMRGKGIPSLMPVSALRAVARRFEDGAETVSYTHLTLPTILLV